MLILKTLSLEPLHGFGIARRVEQISRGVFKVNPGSLLTALQRLERAGWLDSEWRQTENSRRAKFYTLTRAGQEATRDRNRRLGPPCLCNCAAAAGRSLAPCPSGASSPMVSADWLAAQRGTRRPTKSFATISRKQLRPARARGLSAEDAIRAARRGIWQHDRRKGTGAFLRMGECGQNIFSRPALRGAATAQSSGICGGRHPDAGARRRRKHSHLQRDQSNSLQAASLSSPGAAFS